MQQLEKEIFDLLLEIIGGEANLRQGVAATRNSLHEGFDSVRNATIARFTDVSDHVRKNLVGGKASSEIELTGKSRLSVDKLRVYLRKSESNMSDKENNYICSRTRQIAATIARAIKDSEPGDREKIAVHSFKGEIRKCRENYALFDKYKQGGDKALAEACKFDRERITQFYQSFSGGKEMYDRINILKLEGTDISGLENEMKKLIEHSVNPPVWASSVSQVNSITNNNVKEETGRTFRGR